MRISKKQLTQLAQEYAARRNRDYGIGKVGNIQLKDTDARIAPYNYKLVEYCTDGGAIIKITEALTARQMYEFLTTN